MGTRLQVMDGKIVEIEVLITLLITHPGDWLFDAAN
jgi:hypothetical protein